MLRREGFSIRAIPVTEDAELASLGEQVRSGQVVVQQKSSLPTSFSVYRSASTGDVYGSIAVPSTSKPAAATTQWVSFTYKSLYYSGKREHVPVILQLDPIAFASNSLVGSGITIGDLSERDFSNGGCGNAKTFPGVPKYNTQVEGYWGINTNYIYGSTCSTTGILDGSNYSITVHANVDGHTAVWGSDGVGRYVNTSIGRPIGIQPKTGIFIGSTNMYPTSPGGFFTLSFTNVKTGWF